MRDVRRLGVAVGRPADRHPVEELSFGMRAVDDDKLAVEPFRLTGLGAFEDSTLAGVTGTDVELDDRDGAVGDHVERALLARLVIIERTHGAPLFHVHLGWTASSSTNPPSDGFAESF